VAALRFGIQVPTALDIPETITRVKARPRKRSAAADETESDLSNAAGKADDDRTEGW
jgi:hypothetical protein